MTSPTILSVKDLCVEFNTYGGTVKAVRGVSFDVHKGEVLAVVGESGCGKSVTFQTLMGLIPCPPGKVTSGSALLDGVDLLQLNPRKMEAVRGREMSMIFQDPLTSLNPTMTVGKQIAEVMVRHQSMTYSEALKESINIMQLVQIPEAKKRLKQYPHEFSGGMRQRIMIAIALACKPKLLIADEPTTALDVTIQGQILNLLKSLQSEIDMAVVLITHDLGVVASVSDRVAVMYAGQIVETGTVDEVFQSPSHPYTIGLQAAIPNPLDLSSQERLESIPGSPPDLFAPPQGCSFAERCHTAMKVCDDFEPPKFNVKTDDEYERFSACWIHHNATPSSIKEGLQK